MNKKLILSNSHNAKSFADNDSEFLQSDAFSKVCQLIGNLVLPESGTTLSDDTAFYEERGHYSILINGKRGSGKTTFALTAIKLLEAGKGTLHLSSSAKDDNKNSQTIEIKKGEVINLGILDPTLIDSKEHVLLAVIAKIKGRVEEHYNCEPQAGNNNSSLFTKYAHPLDQWRQALANLAKGLQQLDGIGKDSMQDSIWEDSITIMQEGLDSISAGLQLNQKLHAFIEQSLKVLGAKAFILVLDDIDTFFEKGWPVLEALRKYLTSPYLLTLVCGDLQLYQAQVQRQQWQQLGDLATKYETGPKSRANHEEMIHVLTEQYLLKVLPANRRVELAVVADLDNVSVQHTPEDKIKADPAPMLTECLNKMLEMSYQLASNTSEGRLFYNFLTRRPLRMTIQLLQSLEGDELPVEALQNIFADWVYQQGASKLLQKSDSNPLLIQQLLAALHTSGLMQDNLELLPRYSEDSRNAGAAVASRLLCNYFTKNPGAALDFMVRGGLARQAVYFSGVNDKRPADEDIMRALAATTSDDLLTVTRQWAPVVVHGLSCASKLSIQLGTVQILAEGAFVRNRSKKALKNLYRTSSPHLVRAYAEAEKDNGLISNDSTLKVLAKGMLFLGDYYKQQKTKEASKHYALSPLELQTVLENNQQPELAELAGVLFVVVSQGNNNYNRASALNLIGFLGTLISLAGSTKFGVQGSLNSLTGRLSKLVSYELKRAGQIRTYPVPVDFSLFNQEEKPDEADDNDDQNADEETESPTDDIQEVEQGKKSVTEHKLVEELAAWLASWHKVQFNGLAYPPHVWSRIWQRFYYTLEQQDKTYEPRHRFLGVIIHRQIIGFLNAVLVEELRHTKDMDKTGSIFPSVSLNNPVLADDIYVNNLRQVYKYNSKTKEEFLPLYKHLASCPIWQPFFQQDFYQEVSAHEASWSYLDKNSNTKLTDLLNLVSLAHNDETSIPTLWTHAVIQNTVLKNEKIRPVLKAMIKPVTDSNIAVFVREHLSRTSNAAIVDALKALKAE